MAGDDGSIGSGSGGGGGGIRDREDEVHVQIAGQFSARYLSLSRLTDVNYVGSSLRMR